VNYDGDPDGHVGVRGLTMDQIKKAIVPQGEDIRFTNSAMKRWWIPARTRFRSKDGRVTEQYPDWQRSMVADSGVAERLAAIKVDAVVLERIARGAGTTNWFVCRRPEDLPLSRPKFWPGSKVSFYFDGRLRHTRFTTTSEIEILDIIVDSEEKSARRVATPATSTWK